MSNYRKIVVIILMSWIASNPSMLFGVMTHVNSLRFQHISVENGLPHAFVRSIIQDPKGFMWFGTFDGVCRYDGYHFSVYRHEFDNPNSLPNNIIRSMTLDRNGILWVGTSRGAAYYDTDNDCFRRIAQETEFGPANADINDIFEDSRGQLWAGTEAYGLIQIDRSGTRHLQYLHEDAQPGSIGSNDIEVIFEDSRGRLWISVLGAGVDVFEPETRRFINFRHDQRDPQSIAGNEIHAIVEDKNGILIFACYHDGLSMIHADSIGIGAFTNMLPETGGLSDPSVKSLMPDSFGGLWIGMESGGLDYLFPGHGRFSHFEHDILDSKSLSNNSIYTLYYDSIGNLWIGTYAGGVDLLDNTRQVIQHYRHLPGKENSLHADYVWEFAEDAKGNIWIASDGGGLNHFDPVTLDFTFFCSENTNLDDDAVLSVFIDSREKIWAGTWKGGLKLFDPVSKSFRTRLRSKENSLGNRIFDIDEDDQGNLWIATHSGFCQFNPVSGKSKFYNVDNSSLPFNYIEVIKTDCYHQLLLGSLQGFFIFNPETERFTVYRHDPNNEQSISSDYITSIFEEDSTTLWIATNQGLNRLNRKTGLNTRFLEKDGLPSDLIYGIEKDDQGQYWISTGKGLSRLDPELKVFKNFTTEDGVQDNTYIKKSHLHASSGLLFFGGVNGFNGFDPSAIRDNQNIPPVIITKFLCSNIPVPIGPDSPLTRQIFNMKELILDYRQSDFSFEYAALNFISPFKNRYAFKLEGYEKEWNNVGSRRLATYTNINPGIYTFRVKGSNNDGIWNEEGAAVKIRIIPPFWRQWWFRILILMIVLMGSIGLYESRILRIRKQREELELLVTERTNDLLTANQELEQQKSAIQQYAEALKQSNEDMESFSYSVSHDLRTPLRGMNGFSQALIEDYSEKLDERGVDYLTRISKASQRMSHLIDGLLKLSRLARNDLHPETVNLSGMALSIIDDYHHHLMPEKPFQVEVEPKLMVCGDRTLLRILLTNLIDNAWKFTSLTPNPEIKIGSLNRDGQTIYYVRDTGIGFDMQYADQLFDVFQRQNADIEGTGIGLATVKRIVQRHNGRIWAEGAIGQGAVFYFTLNLKEMNPVNSGDDNGK